MTRSVRAGHQVAALPVRLADPSQLEALLVTSRETQRWVVPKGWPMKGRADHEAAAIEAEQEAGVIGRIDPDPIGEFNYFKRQLDRFETISVTVFRLDVDREKKTWREDKQRQRRWFILDRAAEIVQEPGLAHILKNLK